jgi:O-antigen biosynthesis protein
MTLSVIIVNYNVRQFLENALASIVRALEGIEGEVIVVDNASDDGSVEMVREKYPAVRVLANSENIGFARANNLAFKEARGEWLLLINPDTVVQEDTLRVMLEFFRSHPETGLAGCKILNPDGSFQLPCRRSFPTPWVAFTKIIGLSAMFPKSRVFGRYNLTYLDPDASYEVDAVSGSFMMVSRTAFEKVGGLDESFFMYGEDLDWCYRIRQAGFSIYYVHETQIVHFKGESTRRSNVNEVQVFYGAMVLFVEKHFSASRVVRFFLRLGIALRGAAAMIARSGRSMAIALGDAVIVAFSVAAGEYIGQYVYFSRPYHFPSYAYPMVWIIPAAAVLVVGSFLGLYSTYRGSIRRSAAAVVISYVLLAATVFFVKTFAFSRAVTLISGVLAFLLLPGWRVILHLAGNRSGSGAQRRGIFGSRTLIVGTGPAGQEVLRRLRAHVENGYDVQGFIDTNNAHIGDRIGGIEIAGSLENVGKVIAQRRITDVIFSTDEIPYTAILSVIAHSSNRSVNFRMVPTSLEAIIGKTRIDDLDTLPLVEIDYNIHRLRNRIVKRGFDVAVSSLLLLTAYPIVRVLRMLRILRKTGPVTAACTLLPRVFGGDVSLVGLPLDDEDLPVRGRGESPSLTGMYLGPRGMTGLVQLHDGKGLTREERERYALYYAKNQSLLLDVDILMKSVMNAYRG